MSSIAVEPPQPNTLEVSQPVESIEKKDEPGAENSILKYVIIGVLIVALVFLIYYAYNRFVANSLSESMTKGVEQERDDPVIDFNLREAIKNLQNMQKRVLSTLSETVDI